MRILITNDDGIHAPGLAVLETIAAAIGDEVWVVAPETDQSGKAHSLTLSDPLRLRHIEGRRYAVRGTPTDCVIMGIRHVLPEKPDLVLSGINRGSNIADDVTYSGTVAGAMEGTILGVPSIALSQAFPWKKDAEPGWDCAEALGVDVVRKILEVGIPKGVLMNVNFPDRKPEEVSGIEVTRQGARNEDLIHVEERIDGRGFPYYWIGYRPKWLNPEVGTDLWALDQGAVSITPLRLDFTDHAVRQSLQHAFR
ncbi:5'/3'-nucleotidase SurE [Methyloraptor flagellatus]|uniref:5'-nucleotidase SurE n=1 Tax=Methyloraptor flagellatus TaxID=3162530 RepID=A0AAU7XER9_9HYPH